MDSLEPNSPYKRLAYTVKQYRGTKNERILPSVISVSLLLLGRDQWEADWTNRYANDLDAYYWYWNTDRIARRLVYEGIITEYESRHLEEAEDGQTPLHGLIDKIYDGELQAMNAPPIDGGLDPHHPLDFVIPWVGRELGRLSKAAWKGEATPVDFHQAVNALGAKATAIGMWAQAEKVDLTKTSLAEALDAVRDYDFGDDDVEQGLVVHEWPDGWTVQALRTQKELDDEGESMQHCVAGYCFDVQQAQAWIFSIRDAKGRPHVTIEWRPFWRMSEVWNETDFNNPVILDPRELLASPKHTAPGEGRFVQIMGKQNEMPKVEYRRRVHDFIDAYFHGDPLAKLHVPIPDEVIDATNRHFEDHDFVGFPGAAMSLDDIDFSGSTFDDVNFGAMNDVKFDGATFNRCEFHGNLHTCSFKHATFDSTPFFQGRCEHCDFSDTNLDRVRFAGRYFYDCNLDRMTAKALFLLETSFVESSLRDAAFSIGEFDRVAIINSDLSGFTVRNMRAEQLWLADLDLRGADAETVRILKKGSRGFQHAVVGARDVIWPEVAGAAE